MNMKTNKPIWLLGIGACALLSCAPGASTSTDSNTQGGSSEGSSSGSQEATLSAQDVLNALNPEDGLAFSLSLTVVNPYDQSNNIYSEIKGYEGEGETYLEENGALTHHYHENGEGNAVVPTLTKDNEVVEVEVMTIDQDTLEYVNVPYADLVDNPFKELELSDIDESETGFAIELSDEDGLRYGYFLTGYEDIEVDKLTIEVENGEIGQIKGECADIGTALEQNLLFPEFTMSLIAKEEAVNEPTPYPEREEQQAIAEAFEKLKQGNYTANLIDVDSTGYYADVHGTLEVSEGLVYATYSQGIEDNEDNGYIVTKEGYIAPYLEQDGGIVGTAREQEGTLQDILVADYSIDPALFIPQDENTFVLASEVTDYAYLANPAYYIDLSYDIVTPGTFTFEIGADGYSISYDYYYADVMGNYFDGSVSIKITEIGTTEPAYTLDDFTPYVAPGNFEELGVAEALSPWLNGDVSALPYPSEEMGAGLVETQETSEYFGIYATPLGETDEDLTALIEAYKAALEAAGWVYAGLDFWGIPYYTLAIGDAMASVSIGSNYGALSISVNPPSMNNELTKLFTDVLIPNPNSTIEMVITESTFSGFNTPEQALESSSTIEYSIRYGEENAFVKAKDGNIDEEIYYIYDEAEDRLNMYKLVDGEYVYDDFRFGDMKSAIFTWSDMTAHTGNIEEGEGGEYIISGDTLSRMIFVLRRGEEDIDASDFDSAIATYDEGKGEVIITATKESALSGGLTKLMTLSITISDIGTTEVSLPE